MAGNVRLRVAVVGCGGVAQARHLPAWRRLDCVELVAVCDRDEQLLKRVASRFKVSRYYADFAEMLMQEEIDIIDITVSPQAHAALCIQALNNGCHVLVEKPIAESLKETDDIIELAEKKGRKLCVVHNNLYAPPVLKARAMIGKGLIGEVRGIDIKCPWPNYAPELADENHWYHRLPGGFFGEILPHTVYLAIAFLGRVEPVAAYTKKFSEQDWIRADELRVILDGEKGLGTITISGSWAKNKVLIDIFGTKKCLHLDVINSVVTEYAYGYERYRSHVAENLKQGWIFLKKRNTGLVMISAACLQKSFLFFIRRSIPYA